MCVGFPLVAMNEHARTEHTYSGREREREREREALGKVEYLNEDYEQQ